jgi:imidazoleglycerol-phosphate dehydratase
LARIGNSVRTTKETKVKASVEIDGSGESIVKSGVPLVDHLIVTLATHSLMNIQVEAAGDLVHHVVEDAAIVLGAAISEALGNRNGIMRFGYALVPMDEALAIASVDLVRRSSSSVDLKITGPHIEEVPSQDLTHFLSSLATSLEATLHVRVQYGENDHHKVEAAFKALALSLRQACTVDARRSGPPSSKGAL